MMRTGRGGVERITVTEQKAKEMEDWARQVTLPLFLYVRSFRIPTADAWDIVQEVFFHICTREEPLPEAPNLRKALWLNIAKLRVLGYFNERERHGERAALAREYAIFAGTTCERDWSALLEAREQLELVLPALSDDQYDVFTTKVLDGLKTCEIAAQLGMNEHTARRHLSLALEVLLEKLESLEHRGARGIPVFLAISSILALADTASAMVGRIKRFFGSFAQFTLRSMVGAAMAAAVLLSPPNSGASAEHSPRSETQTAPNTMAPPEMQNVPSAPEKPAAGVSPTVSPVSTSIAPRSPKAVKALPPDYLLTKAMSAIRNGNPEKALELLDKYPVQNLRWADELRARAMKALTAKKPAVQ